MAANAVLLALEAASVALTSAGVRHALVGGAALPAWGRIRATADADVYLGVEDDRESRERLVSTLVGVLRAAGFAHLERADRRRVEQMWILHFWFPIRDQGFSIRLDLIVDAGPAAEEILSRASLRKVNDFHVPVASCEDLVLLKLAAGRPVDLADVQALLEANRETLDMGYLESRAASRNLSDALRSALRAIGPDG